MKTIVFYSYKGGVGRSLALCNIAICLARLGKNVILVDLDFEAPGLIYKLKPNKVVNEGIMDFIFEFKKTNWNVIDNSNIEDVKQRSVDNKVTRLDITKYGFYIFEKELKDRLFLLPTGNTDKKQYWQRLLSNEWVELFSFYDIDDDAAIKKERFFSLIKENIVSSEINPDYFLVDCRCGMSGVQDMSLTIWADTILTFFNNNHETLENLGSVLDYFRELKPAKGDLNFIPVITRFSASLQRRLLPEMIEKINRKFFAGREKAVIYTLHTDYMLELEEELKIATSDETENTCIAHEYIKLCAEILSQPEREKEKLEATIKEIEKAIQISESEGLEYRFFDLKTLQGIMTNPNDNTRNVSFKNETFVNLMKGLYEQVCDEVYKTGKDYEHALKDVDKIFHKVGYESGEKFATSLVHLWNKSKEEGGLDKRNLNPYERIKEWCEFDSDVGFGKFEMERIDPNNVEKGGIISLKNNFLASYKHHDENEPDLCRLMTGYIEGVLHVLLRNRDIRIEHDLDDCMRIQHNRGSCDFKFATLKISTFSNNDS